LAVKRGLQVCGLELRLGLVDNKFYETFVVISAGVAFWGNKMTVSVET